MPKCSPQQLAARKEEIMDACEALYQTKIFRDITLKDIGEKTSFTRTSIYNYFESKEEIFLALFEREYWAWTAELEQMNASAEPLTPKTLAKEMAAALEERKLMLKLLAVNLYDMEENSRMERLVSFKQAYGASVEQMRMLLQRLYPDMNAAENRRMLVAVLQFLHGLYPYAFATEKQKAAMDQAGVPYEKRSIEDMSYEGLQRLLQR
jgi:AcrR family transcriptional regulator